MSVLFVPLGHWSGPITGHRVPAPFTAGWDKTYDLLHREVRALTGPGQRTPDIVIELDVHASLLRLDHQLRAGARPDTPRVAVSFPSRHGPLRYECDRFHTPRDGARGWQANVRAIALGLEALRTVDRYGIGARGEQYTGWVALPAAAPPDPFHDDVMLLAREGRFLPPDVATVEWVRDAYRAAARRHHPDAGGVAQMFRAVTEARDRLIAHLT